MHRETRFLVLSLLLIVLPSLLLSYFGLQAIQKESQALEARFHKTVTRFGGEISTEIEQTLQHHEGPLRELLIAVPRHTSDLGEAASIFRAAVLDSPYFGEVQLIDRAGRSPELTRRPSNGSCHRTSGCCAPLASRPRTS